MSADKAAFRSLNRTDTLAARRALTRLQGVGLLRRSEQRRGLTTHRQKALLSPPPTPLDEGKRLFRDELADCQTYSTASG